MTTKFSASPTATTCLAPLPSTTPSRLEAPARAWDCHAHVLGPFDQFPLQSERGYTPPESTQSAYALHLETLGLQRGVLVQPSVYGHDNQLLCHVLKHNSSSLRGIAVLSPHADSHEVKALHAFGVRGFRINMLFPGGPGMQTLERSAELVADLGWHAQLLIDIRHLAEINTRLDRLPIPIVFDHMGHFPYELGTNWDGFHQLLKRLDAGKTYVKLSGSYRLSPRTTHASDVTEIARKLVNEAPQRLVWGSDWPHVGLMENMPDTSTLLDALVQWCPDEPTRQKILCSTPDSLYL